MPARSLLRMLHPCVLPRRGWLSIEEVRTAFTSTFGLCPIHANASESDAIRLQPRICGRTSKPPKQYVFLEDIPKERTAELAEGERLTAQRGAFPNGRADLEILAHPRKKLSGMAFRMHARRFSIKTPPPSYEDAGSCENAGGVYRLLKTVKAFRIGLNANEEPGRQAVGACQPIPS